MQAVAGFLLLVAIALAPAAAGDDSAFYWNPGYRGTELCIHSYYDPATGWSGELICLPVGVDCPDSLPYCRW